MNRETLLAVMVLGWAGMLSADGTQMSARPATAGVEISYEDFAALTQSARLEVFNRMDSNGKADLLRTHLQRWRDSNKERLTADQLEFISMRALPVITPDLYDRPVAEEKVQEMRQVEEDARQLFAPEDISAAFHLIGIPGRSGNREH